jgi:hypothetical protein
MKRIQMIPPIPEPAKAGYTGVVNCTQYNWGKCGND